MNTTLVVLVFITLICTIIFQYLENKRLSNIITKKVEENLNITRQKRNIIRVTKSLLVSIWNTNGKLPIDRVPFISREYFNSIKAQELDSIRFRLKDGKVLIYTNGTINPTKDIIELENITSLNDEHFALVIALKEALDTIDKSTSIPLTPKNITNLLTTYN